MALNIKNIFDNETFERFKLIKHLINKYPIKEFDLTEINQIKDAYVEYEVKYNIVNKNLKFEDSEFIDTELKEEIEKFKKYIHISEPKIDIKISHDTISDNLINKIYSIVKLFKKLYGEKDIELKIVLCRHKRAISKKIIGTVNVNGGLNYVGTGKIHLFRREELLKVLCHELIHSYKLDCRNIDKFQNKILKDFNIKMDKNINSIVEAFCEYNACIHHIALISYYTKVSPFLIYHYEKIWCLYQVCKILNHYNLKKFEDLYTNDFIQGTNVFSYYIIKFFILYRLDNKCSHKNLLDILNDQEIIQIINENMNQSFDKNLRMTLFELKV